MEDIARASVVPSTFLGAEKERFPAIAAAARAFALTLRGSGRHVIDVPKPGKTETAVAVGPAHVVATGSLTALEISDLANERHVIEVEHNSLQSHRRLPAPS